ncbi:hypothetical protein JKG47_15925 [Acidithiobacillus sp. MC6.1]|nr:hypothetical protein [Acidithiobacillus sp. MC6.1]
MRNYLFIFFMSIFLACFSVQSASAIDLFASQEAAQVHCPKDTVVWLNTKTGVWHYRGERWYGRTRYGAYVCEKSAARAGDRGTENGQ